jgi:hypothetical protein
VQQGVLLLDPSVHLPFKTNLIVEKIISDPFPDFQSGHVIICLTNQMSRFLFILTRTRPRRWRGERADPGFGERGGAGRFTLKFTVDFKDFSNSKKFTVRFKDLLQQGGGGVICAAPVSAWAVKDAMCMNYPGSRRRSLEYYGW